MMGRLFERGLDRDYGFNGPMMQWVTANGWVGWLVFGICMLVVVAIIVCVVILIAKMIKHSEAERAKFVSPAPTAPVTPAMKLLDERYAKGEISDEEYRTKKENLK